MFAGAAVCPQPPLLVPEVAAGAAAELDGLRAACDASVGAVLAGRPDRVVVVGGATASESYDGGAGGTLREYGVDVRAGGAHLVLPLSLTLGAWLLDRASVPAGMRSYVAVGTDAPTADCVALGSRLVSPASTPGARVALLVMADGSARRTDTSPGRVDEAAIPYDDAVFAALRTGDRAALRGLDPDEAARLMVGGRAAWQVLAGAAGDIGIAAAVAYEAAPYGVGYVVATWLPI